MHKCGSQRMGYTPMFDNFLIALPIIVIAAIALWLVNGRRIKRGQLPFPLPWWLALIAGLAITGIVDLFT